MSTTALPGAVEDDSINVNRGPTILASCAVPTLLAMVSVALRIWVRLTTVRDMGVDVSYQQVLVSDYMLISSRTM
jgi:hypothetical protein